MGHCQLDLFEAEGADMRRVAVGHLDVQPHLRPLLGYYVELASRGASLVFDTVGKEGCFELELDPAYGQKFPDDTERAEIVAELVCRGYATQILVSCDVDTVSLTRSGTGNGYARLLEFVTSLTQVGLSTADIQTILVENPRRLLTLDSA
jgi:phosphotriesterase-related protein